MYRFNTLLKLISAWFFTMGMMNAGPVEVYVSPSGSNSADGTQARPVATLQEALKRVRSAGPAASKIWLMDGFHSIPSTLVIDAFASGDPDRPLTIAAANGAKPRIIGGRVLQPGSFRKVATGDAAYQRLPQAARSQVYVYQLDGVAREGASKLAPRGTANRTGAPVTVFMGDEPMDLARWPDRGNWDPPTGVENGFFVGADSAGGLSVTAPNAPIARWRNATNVWAHGYFGNDWGDNHLKIAGIDAAGKITFASQPAYGFGTKRPFYVYNLPEELSRAGEYWIDSDTGLLYLWPKTAIGSQPIYVSELSQTIIRMQDARNIVFRGITFEASRWTLLETSSVNNITFHLCTFRNSGANGVLFDGRESTFSACEFYNIGAAGLGLGGGDRQRLVRGNNQVVNCYFHDTGRNYMHATAGALVMGVGNSFRNNLIANTPATALQFNGNLNIIKENDVVRACNYSDDQGAIYSGRDFAGWGNEFSGNVVRHVRTRRGTCKWVHAIYLDDFSSGSIVRGNVVYDVSGVGVNCGGGRSNIMENNVIAQTGAEAHLNDNRGMKWANTQPGHAWNILEQYDKAGVREAPWTTLFPQLAATPTSWSSVLGTTWLSPRDSVFARNVLWGNIACAWESNWTGVPNSVFGTYAAFGPNAERQPVLFTATQLERRTTRPLIESSAVAGFASIDARKAGPAIDYTCRQDGTASFPGGSFMAAMAGVAVPEKIHGDSGFTPQALSIEYFHIVAGTPFAELAASMAGTPWRVVQTEKLRMPDNMADNYAARIRGYIVPQKGGNYNFHIAADDVAEFSLSTSEALAGKRVVASCPGWVSQGQWTKYSEQTSAPIALAAGQKYYFELVLMEGSGGDFAEVQWTGPDGVRRPVPIDCMRPFATPSTPQQPSEPEVVEVTLGEIEVAYYEGLPGGAVSNLTSAAVYPAKPTSKQVLTQFATAVDRGDNYGMAVRGYLVPPVTGQYRFWIACDDNGSLRLSTNYQKENAREIASVPGWTRVMEWDKYIPQGSKGVNLVAGEVYYIEALTKENAGGDHLEVAWTGPGFDRQVISGDYLARLDSMQQTTPSTPSFNLGSARVAFYSNIGGDSVSQLKAHPSFPASPAQVTSVQSALFTSTLHSYGVMMSGYIIPEVSGSFIFHISADDSGQFYLSTGDSPDEKRLLCYTSGWTTYLNFDRSKTQHSAPVQLEAGRPYYFEALMKENLGDSHVAIAWEGPGFGRTVIDGRFLAPAASQ